MKAFLEVEKGKKSDADEIADLFVQCTDFLISLGIQQWRYTYPLISDVQGDIEKEELFVIRDHGNIVATITLNGDQDPQYQSIPWRFKEGNILVMHRLGVHPSYGGRGYGRTMVAFADHFAKKNNYNAIRLDAYSGNFISNPLYEKQGYIKADGYCYFHDNTIPFNCWEKKI